MNTQIFYDLGLKVDNEYLKKKEFKSVFLRIDMTCFKTAAKIKTFWDISYGERFDDIVIKKSDLLPYVNNCGYIFLNIFLVFGELKKLPIVLNSSSLLVKEGASSVSGGGGGGYYNRASLNLENNIISNNREDFSGSFELLFSFEKLGEKKLKIFYDHLN